MQAIDHSRASGFTLIELMVALAVAVILVSVAVPSSQRMIDSRRIVSAAEAVYAQLLTARTESTKRSIPVFAMINANDTTTWAIGISESSGCDPTGGDCTLDFDGVTDVRVIDSVAFPDVIMDSDANGEVTFEPVRATASPTTIEMRSDNYDVWINLSTIGRLDICSPSGTRKMGRYPDC
jgi:type IV fimbrial biogenesis protein FimT